MHERTDVDRVIEMLQPFPCPRAWPALIVLVGPPGAGKSAVARQLAERSPLSVLCADDMRTLLVEKPDYSFNESQRVTRALRASTGELLSRSISVVLDAANLTEWERAPLYGLAEARHARTILVAVTAPTAVAIDRMHEQAQAAVPGGGPASTAVATRGGAAEVYHRLAGRQEPITRDHYSVDTAGDTRQFVDGLVLELDEG